jgi:hypothetical protein
MGLRGLRAVMAIVGRRCLEDGAYLILPGKYEIGRCFFAMRLVWFVLHGSPV